MRMRISLVIILYASIICGCANAGEGDVLTFKHSVDVKTEIISDKSPLMTYPYDMFVTENHIWVLCLMNQKWIHCYDKHNGEYLSSFVPQGRGPGELVACATLHLDKNNNELYLYDNEGIKMLTFNVYDYPPSVEFREEKSLVDVSGAVIINAWPLTGENIFANVQCGSMEDSLTRFSIYSKDAALVYNCSDTPFLKNDDRYTYQQSFMTLSQDRRRFASITLFGEILEIYNLTERNIEKVVERVYSSPNIEFKNGVLWETDRTIWGFPFVCSDDNFIYSPMIHSKDIDSFNKIAVFDWEGQGCLKMVTDYNILRLSSYKDVLYGIVADKSQGFLFSKYQIPIELFHL